MASKNCIVLHNQQFGYHKFSVLHSFEIFNRTDMVNLLEAIENKTYVYDDIIGIDVSCLLEINVINDLPHKLQVLKIKSTTLDTLTIPEDCVDLKEISIKDSNLTAIPNIHFLTKLTILNIENSNLRHIPSRFPPSIVSINFTGNSLTEHNTNLAVLPKNIPIILFNNNFIFKQTLPEHNICYGSQGSYKHKTITNYILQREEAARFIVNAVGPRNEYAPLTYDPNNLRVVEPVLIRPVVGDIPTVKEQSLFSSTQTVHISSICSSVSKSILKIKELTDIIYKASNKQRLITEFIDAFYTNPTTEIKYSNWFEWLLDIPRAAIRNSSTSLVKYNTKEKLESWINNGDVHTNTQVTYSELLARIWILIKNHEQKNDFIENVKIELNASVGMCFTGRINRLVNSLIGFVDGITVGISMKEQLQLEIGKIIAKLSKKEITYEVAIKEITALFDDPEVREDETITTYYRQAWLDALDDYKPEEEQKDDDITEEVLIET
jgi:hypothetical protein